MKDWSTMFAQSTGETNEEAHSQPTGATTTGSGKKSDQAIPALQKVEAHYQPQAQNAPVAPPSNTWTQLATSQIHTPPDPWVKERGHDSLAGPTADQVGAMAAMLAHVSKLDSFFDRMRSRTQPKPWSTISAGGMGTGLAMGTIGAGTIYPGRCMLEGVHNATSTAVTFGVSDTGSGDPTPKFSCTVGAGVTIPIGVNGMLFPHGISLVAMTPGGTLTFFGSDAVE